MPEEGTEPGTRQRSQVLTTPRAVGEPMARSHDVAPAAASAGADRSLPTDDSSPADLVVVGRVAGAYGVHGWVRVTPYSPARESVLCTAGTWWLEGPVPARWPIAQVRVHGDSVIARTPAVTSREQALALKGRELSVSRAVFPAGGDDDHYWVDLIGCAVVNPRGVGLGTVQTLADHGGHSLLVVGGPDGVERMIPFVEQYIVRVDTPARTIVADWDLDY